MRYGQYAVAVLIGILIGIAQGQHTANFGRREGTALQLPDAGIPTPTVSRGVSVVQLVFCTASDADWRQLHRDTWISEANRCTHSAELGPVAVRVFFVIGSLIGLDPDLVADVKRENASSKVIALSPCTKKAVYVYSKSVCVYSYYSI
jgi:hypothetical protein